MSLPIACPTAGWVFQELEIKALLYAFIASCSIVLGNNYLQSRKKIGLSREEKTKQNKNTVLRRNWLSPVKDSSG